MNGPTATYAFLPWLRRGVSTEITRREGDETAGARAEIDITVSFDAGGETRSATTKLALYGPGEVTGIDSRMIIRTHPRPDVYDAESNYFPMIEFDQPDFPWRYTPARANPQDRLRPWLVLIVLTDDEIEGEGTEPASTDGRLPVITVKSADSLPDLSQSWAWAHVQIAGMDDSGTEAVSDIIENEPHRVLSRLLCARYLKPRTTYTAYLVPSFERGRLAGLKETIPEGLDAMTPAWQSSDSNAAIRLPVYYEWCFGTGVAGDFEYLVRQLLPPRALPKGVGRRDMDVSKPGAGLPPAASTPLGLEGALMAPASQNGNDTWDLHERRRFVSKLIDLLNRPAMMLERCDPRRLVAPPLYGQWHAARRKYELIRGPLWFHQLNADPRLRIAAGLGTLVVQDQQQQLMASAWNQVEGVLELNERLRQAQLAREVAMRIHDRHVKSHDPETALLIAGPMHTRLPASPQTIQAVLQQSPVANGTLEGQFRRVARPLGPIGRRQGRPGRPRETTLLGRMNRGELSPAPPPPTPEGMTTPSRTGADLAPPWATPTVLWLLRALLLLLLIIAAFSLLLAALLFFSSIAVAAFLAALCIGSLAGALLIRRMSRSLSVRTGLRDGTLTADDIRSIPAASSFEPAEATSGNHVPQPRPPTGGTRIGQGQAVADLRTALAEMVTQANAAPAAASPPVPVDIQHLHNIIITAIDPRTTVVAAIRPRLRIALGEDDPLEPVMAAPEFEQPMYEPLRDLSQEWLLPGVGQIPANTVSLLATNQRFVESYMVGLSHEMARELLWHEYPTDQRGTYFRQFWDVRGYVARPDQQLNLEKLKDIKSIHDWESGAELGTNSSREAPPDGEHLVLMIRGDVLHRYPNTIVYANKAERDEGGKRVLGEEQRYPVFQGTLKPDISFFGFELTHDQVRGSTDPDADQGWFFILQEQPTEPRFGLNVAEHYGHALEPWDEQTGRGGWQDLSWGHLVLAPEELATLRYIDLNSNLPDTRNLGQDEAIWHADDGLGDPGASASDIAYITLQLPFCVAVHGSDMLLPKEEYLNG